MSGTMSEEAAGTKREEAAGHHDTVPAESAVRDREGGAATAKRDQELGVGGREAARELRERAEAAWCAACTGGVRDRGLREALPLYKRALRECGGGNSAILCSYARCVLLARVSLSPCVRARARARAYVLVRV